VTHPLILEVLEDRSLLSFSPVTSVSVGAYPYAVASGYFNADGNLDLATANIGDDTVSVLLGNGDGTFQAAHLFATGPSPLSVAVGDFNGDGLLDLATANSDYYSTEDNDVSILIGNRDGTFNPAVSLSTGSPSYSESITTGDLNADRKPDLVVTSNDGFLSAYVSVLLSQPDGTLAPAATYGPYYGQLSAPAVADVNRDGNDDVAVADWYAGSAKVFLANADGTLQAPSDFLTASGAASVVVGYFNADGNLDLATANANDDTVSVLLGNGDGTFQAAQPFAAGDNPTSSAAGDINGDGLLDLFVINPGSVTVLYGNGDGSFAAPIPSAAGSSYSAVLANFTADARLDAAVVNLGSVSVLINDGIWPSPDAPRISINDVIRKEGNGRTTVFTFTVTLSAAYDQAVTVNYATADGTAKVSDNDYVATSGTLTFAPGQTTKTVTVVVKGDKKQESNESFFVNLGGESDNVLLFDAQGLGIIVNDDR
jgi:hypothetical protein